MQDEHYISVPNTCWFPFWLFDYLPKVTANSGKILATGCFLLGLVGQKNSDLIFAAPKIEPRCCGVQPGTNRSPRTAVRIQSRPHSNQTLWVQLINLLQRITICVIIFIIINSIEPARINRWTLWLILTANEQQIANIKALLLLPLIGLKKQVSTFLREPFKTVLADFVR